MSSWLKQAQTAVGTFFGQLPVYAADILIFGPLGIFLGFLFKTLGRYLLIGLFSAAVIVWFADYMQIITVHQAQVQAFFGGHQLNSLHDVGTLAMAVMREHIAAVFAALIGFILGWKLGS